VDGHWLFNVRGLMSRAMVFGCIVKMDDNTTWTDANSPLQRDNEDAVAQVLGYEGWERKKGEQIRQRGRQEVSEAVMGIWEEMG